MSDDAMRKEQLRNNRANGFPGRALGPRRISGEAEELAAGGRGKGDFWPIAECWKSDRWSRGVSFQTVIVGNRREIE